MKCALCNQEIILVPSAKERAEKYGRTPEFYTNLFKVHGECQVRKNKEDPVALMRKLNEQSRTK